MWPKPFDVPVMNQTLGMFVSIRRAALSPLRVALSCEAEYTSACMSNCSKYPERLSG
jgi:hypothetical protein